MASKFIIEFDVPTGADGNLEFVVDEKTLESDSDSEATVEAPLQKMVSPAVAVDSGSAPDVQILPTATSTSGQAGVIHRTATTGITFTWTEAVREFGSGSVSVVAQGDQEGATATLENFQGISGSTSYRAQVRFPSGGSGIVTVTVGANSARSVANGNEGPNGPRTLSLSYDQASGVTTLVPQVEIQLPAAVPYIGETAPIQFVWNIPVTNFTESDITLDAGVTIEDDSLTRTNDCRIWEAVLELPSVTSNTTVTATVAANSVSSQEGVSGPAAEKCDTFIYKSPAGATLGGAPDGTTVICDHSWDVDDLNYLTNALQGSVRNAGGAVYGVTDLTKIGNNIYGVVQVRKKRDGGDNELADSVEAAAALFRAPIGGGGCTILKAYPSILEAARSITALGSNVHWFEGSGYLYQVGYGSDPINNPRVGNLGTYNVGANCVSTLGKVWRIALGRQFGGTFQKDFGVCGGTMSPLLSHDGKLYALPGVGNVDYVNYQVNRRYLFQSAGSTPRQPEGVTYNPDTNALENLGDWSISQPPDNSNLFGLFGDNLYVQEVEIDLRGTPRVLLVGDVREITRDDLSVGSGDTDPVYGIPTATTGDAISAQADNWPLVRYSADIEPRLQLVETNQITTWDLLLEFAQVTQTILSFQDGLVFFKPRLPVQAQLNGTLTDSANALNFTYATENINRQPFQPNVAAGEKGTIVIGNEVITYESVGATSLGTLERGRSDTTAAAHTSGATITFVDHVLTERTFLTPVEEVVIESDIVNVYNSIEVVFDNNERRHRVEDQTAAPNNSIENYGERVFTLNAPFLSKHQAQWVQWAADHALRTFKNLESIIRLTLKPRFNLTVGDYVYLAVPRDEIRRIGIIVRIIYSTHRDQVDIDVRTITEDSN